MFKKTVFAAIAASIVGAGAIAASSPAEATFLKKDRYYEGKATYHDGHHRKGMLWWKKDKHRGHHGWKHKKHKKHYVEPAPQYKYRPMK